MSLNVQTDTHYSNGQLIDLLSQWGVHYLFADTSDFHQQNAEPRLSDVEFIKALASCEAPRVRDASIGLFLLHPELVDAIIKAWQTSAPPLAERIATLTLATLYLQRLWSFRLTNALGHPTDLQERPFAYLWQMWHLPAPGAQFGEVGLYLLQAYEQKRQNTSLNLLGDWQNQVDHLLRQEEAQNHPVTCPARLSDIPVESEEQEDTIMSMRRTATRKDIEQFLQTLGKLFRKSARLYLVGGAALVHLGIRAGSTIDIDLVIETPDEDEMVTAIRRIVEQQQINVEFASPEDFIPVPMQWKAHARYIGRYGSIEAFYFDFYSLALSKIARGTDRDLNDVRLLVQQQVISLEELDEAYHDILPRMGKRPYLNLDPHRFAERYVNIRQQLSTLS